MDRDTLLAAYFLDKSNKNRKAKGGDGCYIATNCYGSYDCPEVLVLRKFRDEKLLTNFLGKLFVKIYYSISPWMVRNFDSKLFKKISRKVLDKLLECL